MKAFTVSHIKPQAEAIFRTGALLLFIAPMLFATGCYYDNAEELYQLNQDTIDTSTAVSYTDHIQPLVNSTCALSGCHISGTGRQVFTDYQGIKNAIENFDLQARVESGSMPPGGNINETKKEQLIRWIENGYPDN